MIESAMRGSVERLVSALGRQAREQGCTVATAESLTGGQLAAALAAAPEAREWYRGGVVAYQAEVKYSLLGAPHGPVVTAATAESMARAVSKLFDSDFSVGVTGVGGPEPDEGEPPGTVYLAVYQRAASSEGGGVSERFEFDGAPVDVMQQTICAALEALLTSVERRAGDNGGNGPAVA